MPRDLRRWRRRQKRRRRRRSKSPFDSLTKTKSAQRREKSRLCVVLYLVIMAAVEHPTGKTLAELGVSDAVSVHEKFAEVRRRFDFQISLKADEIRNLMLQEAWLGSDSEPATALKNFWVGRKSGVLTLITENWLKKASPSLRAVVGKEFNDLKTHIEAKLEEQRLRIEAGAEEAANAKDRVDLSLPGAARPLGSRHLIRQVFQEIEDIFFSIGFSVVEGPEIETPYYNFEALNIPEFHPVRDDMDTFYLDLAQAPVGSAAPTPLLLRTHTSPMQIRTMEKRK